MKCVLPPAGTYRLEAKSSVGARLGRTMKLIESLYSQKGEGKLHSKTFVGDWDNLLFSSMSNELE